MRIIDYLKNTGSLDEFANLIVFPTKASDMGTSWTIWRFMKLNGQPDENCYENCKEDAIKKAKEYLNSKI